MQFCAPTPDRSNGTKAAPKTDDKPKKDKQKRHLPSLPSAASAADMNPVTFSGLSDKTAVEWSSLRNYEMFSLSADGSFPMMKVSCSKAVRLADRQVMMVGSGRCFGIWLCDGFESGVKRLLKVYDALPYAGTPMTQVIEASASPEVAHVKSRRGEAGLAPLLWGWLAGIRKSTRYDRLYSETVGLGITATVRKHAKRICDLQCEGHDIEGELQELLCDRKSTGRINY